MTASCISAALRTRTSSAPCGGVDRRRPGHQRHRGAAPRRFGGDRKPHPAARSVADEANRVEVLEGRPGRHQHPPALERPASPEHPRRPPRRCRPAPRGGPCRSSRTRGSPRPARRTARRAPRACARFCRTAGCSSICVFIAGATSTGARGRQVERRQEVVGDAVGELAEDVRGGRRDEQQVDGRGQRDVLDVGVGAGGPLARDHRVARDRLEGQRPDEPPGVARHDGDDVVPALLQAARDLDGLVGADAAA